MNKTLEGMARAYCKSRGIEPQAYAGVIDGKDAYLWEAVAIDLKASILWLADNVTNEMAEAYLAARDETVMSDVKDGICAALRAAAGGGE